MSKKKILFNPKLGMGSTENHVAKSNSTSKNIILDVDSFKKKMNPKNKSPAVRLKSKKKCVQFRINHSDIENFKLKFHPERLNNQENQPLDNQTVKHLTIRTKLKQASEAKLAAASTVGSKAEKSKKPKTAKFLCDVCCAMFKTSTNLKEHLKIHSSIKEHKCPHCDYSCHRQRNLKIHILTHKDRKPIQCSLCDYTCIQKFQLKAHLLLHQTDAPFTCDLCDAKYKKEAGLKVHLLTHSNNYKFKCLECQYLTNRFADYRRHLLIHTKAKPEKCPYCSYSCIRKSRLRAHMLVHRGENVLGGEDSILSRLGSKLLKCENCDYICTTASRLKKHMKSHVIKTNEFNLMLEKTFALQEDEEQKQNSIILSFADTVDPLPVENTETPKSELVVLPQGCQTPVSLFHTSFNQELLLNHPNTHQIIFTPAHSDNEIFSSENSGLFIPSENQTVLIASSFGHPQPTAIVQNDQPVLISSAIPSWEGEGEWQDTESFTVDQLGPFSFDQIIQPASNFIVTVVKEEQPVEEVKEEPVETPNARNHSTSKMYHCDLCSFSCDYKSTYKKHIRKHENQKNYKCAHCHYMCDEIVRMKKHLIRHTGQKVFQCDDCQFSCKSKPTLQQHILAHSKGIKSGNCLQCPLCDYSCKSMPGLKSHLAKHTGDTHYQCNVCDEKFMTEYLLKKHKFTHGVRPYQCQFCSYSCVQKQQMSIHMLQHTYEYPFCCQLCNAKYKKQDSLKIHMLSQHENKHKFNCDLCNYAGNRAADFREHMLTHSAQKPFQCPDCSYSCIRSSQLRKHLSNHDKANISESRTKSATNNKKIYRCAFCDFTCTRTPRLKAHLTKLHLDLPENYLFSFDAAPNQVNLLQTQRELT